MWKYWVIGILGILTIIGPYLGFSPDMHKFFLVVSGIVITVLSFWALSENRLRAGV